MTVGPYLSKDKQRRQPLRSWTCPNVGASPPMIARPSCSTSPRPRSNAMASAPAPSNGSPSGQASLRSSSTSISALACRCSGHSSNERMLAINPPFGPASPRYELRAGRSGFRRCQPRSLVRRQRDRPAPGRPRTCGPARRPLARRRPRGRTSARPGPDRRVPRRPVDHGVRASSRLSRLNRSREHRQGGVDPRSRCTHRSHGPVHPRRR